MAARSIPLATGILPIALGEATKTVPYVMDGRKTYRFTAALGRGAGDRRRRGRGHRRPPTGGPTRGRDPGRAARASPARSSRCRRPSPPSRSTASGPMTWRGPARRSNWRRARITDPCASAWPPWPTPTTPASRSVAARAPTCARSAATWRWLSALAGIFRPCGGLPVGPFDRGRRRFPWNRWRPSGIVPPPSGIFCRSRPRWTTSRHWP